ncbi:MAG: cytochrome c3 family protein [Acidobacteriota bacterium]
MTRKGQGKRKGTFGEAGLPVARSYVVRPATRRRMLWVGAAGGLLIAALGAVSFLRPDGGLVSKGPLSSHHATLESSCSSCHGGFAPVANDACSACHEKPDDDLGLYTFAAHYVYRSDDFQRVVPSPDEETCIACHGEHGGRDAAIVRATDARCQSCHEFSPFHRRHPEFAFARGSDGETADGGARVDRALAFPHIRHVNELLGGDGFETAEATCFACHEPQADGRSFRPLDFDRHCDACHLASTDRTPPLPVVQAEDGAPGVETLDAIRQAALPGTRWADYLNPGEFRQVGDRVIKSPLYHRDPWVLHNLRLLRQRLIGDGGLADLLTASPDVAPEELRTLYEEAITTLEQQARDLRSVPDHAVQQDIEKIDAILDDLRRRLEDPHVPLDETGFLLALGPPGDRDDDEVARIRTVADALTQPCQQCHTVRDATIVRVENDLRTLRRAEFDHRAHTLQRSCLDCHREIPIAEFAGSSAEVPAELDNSQIHNLPRVASCAECHNQELAVEGCVQCHLFHPDTSRRAASSEVHFPETPNAG